MMKMWWSVAIGAALLASASHAAPLNNEIVLKDGDDRVLAVAVLCNECQTTSADKSCHEGAIDGYLNGKPCGSCLLESNWGVLIRYPRDLSVVGRLMKDDGQPAKKHYVKMFLPNGWSVRTQTREDGNFRMNMGATAEREKGDPLVIDIGERVDRVHSGEDQFSIYLMPAAYNPCAESGSAK
jgi:hypothetical protein